jgi:hypothetical protein
VKTQYGWAIASALLLTSCATLRMYDGPPRERDAVAVVAGDYRFSAGSPLSIILRAVDGQPLKARYNAVEVLPGKHVFVVDCLLRETQAASRHAVTAEVDPGLRYVFVAETAPGMRGCAAVQLESRD